MGGASVHLPDGLFALVSQEEIRAGSDCPLPFSADCPVGGRVHVRVEWGEEGGRRLEDRLFSRGRRDWAEGRHGLKDDGVVGSEKTAGGS